MTEDPTDPGAADRSERGDARASMVVALVVILGLTALVVGIAYFAVRDLPVGH